MAHRHLAFEVATKPCGCHNPRPDARVAYSPTDTAGALLAAAEIIKQRDAELLLERERVEVWRTECGAANDALSQRDAEIAHLRDAFHAHRLLIHSTAPDDEVFDSVEKLNAAFEVTP